VGGVAADKFIYWTYAHNHGDRQQGNVRDCVVGRISGHRVSLARGRLKALFCLGLGQNGQIDLSSDRHLLTLTAESLTIVCGQWSDLIYILTTVCFYA
jgi:hypothetical protein